MNCFVKTDYLPQNSAIVPAFVRHYLHQGFRSFLFRVSKAEAKKLLQLLLPFSIEYCLLDENEDLKSTYRRLPEQSWIFLPKLWEHFFFPEPAPTYVKRAEAHDCEAALVGLKIYHLENGVHIRKQKYQIAGLKKGIPIDSLEIEARSLFQETPFKIFFEDPVACHSFEQNPEFNEPNAPIENQSTPIQTLSKFSAQPTFRVAVVTPYYQPNLSWLRQAHQSVLSQTYPCDHILVGDGFREKTVDEWNVQHISLPHCAKDFGDTPRSIGSAYATRQGYDAIAYLDADNWYKNDHVASLVELHLRTKASLCASGRSLYRLDGRYLGPCFDVDGKHFADTNCFLVTRGAFSLLPLWHEMDPSLHGVGDKVFWQEAANRGLSRAYSNSPTVAYRSSFRFSYPVHREFAPAETKDFRAVIQAERARQAILNSKSRPKERD